MPIFSITEKDACCICFVDSTFLGGSVKSLFVSLIIASFFYADSFSAVNMPFPQHKDYPGCIKPNNISATAMDNAVAALYDDYKSSFLKNSIATTGGYYYQAKGNGGGGSSAVTVSEQHGYGMLITVFMAGHDPDAQTIFDGMFKFYKDHLSTINNYCMGWSVGPGEVDAANSNSATDGDMDIAHSLLLAHSQWGSDGAINYLNEAKSIIQNGLKVSDISQQTYRVMLGDWVNLQSNTEKYYTRCSDWMPDHFRAFASALPLDSALWIRVADTCYSLIEKFNANESSSTGLMPDFVKGATPIPDPNACTTGEKDGAKYGWNGCRYPWRIAVDYAMYGDSRAKTAMNKLTSWLKSQYANPSLIPEGPYNISTGVPVYDLPSAAFIGPFIAGVIASDATNQSYLNAGWNACTAYSSDETMKDAYNCALKLMSMILISGNWWKPGDSPSDTGNTGFDTTGIMFDSYSNMYGGPTIQSDLGEAFKLANPADPKADSAGLWYSFFDNLPLVAGKLQSFVKNEAGTIVDSSNMGEAMSDGVMHVVMQQNTGAKKNKYPYAGIGCSFLRSEEYVDLSNLTAVLLRIKGSGNCRFSIGTKDIATLAEPDSNWGSYGVDLNLASDWQTLIIEAGMMAPVLYSPASDMGWTWDHGKADAKEIGFEVNDSAGNVDLYIDEIKLCGMTYDDLGLAIGNVKKSDESFYTKTTNGSLSLRSTQTGSSLSYTLTNASSVSIAIYNLKGTQVAQIVNQHQAAGHYSLPVSASTLGISSGNYIVRFSNEETTAFCRLNLLRQ